jgi:hypothetical protein
LLIHWKEIEKSETLGKLFPEPPVVAFRRPKSIKDTLVRAAVSRPSSTVGQCKPCGDKRCTFSIHQKPIGSSSVTEVHISSAFDEKKMIFHLLNIQKDNKIQPFSFSDRLESYPCLEHYHRCVTEVMYYLNLTI